MVEKDYANDASSVLLRIAWPRGYRQSPQVDVLARCPRRERCPG
jgi:hypothetical protein